MHGSCQHNIGKQNKSVALGEHAHQYTVRGKILANLVNGVQFVKYFLTMQCLLIQ